MGESGNKSTGEREQLDYSDGIRVSSSYPVKDVMDILIPVQYNGGYKYKERRKSWRSRGREQLC